MLLEEMAAEFSESDNPGATEDASTSEPMSEAERMRSMGLTVLG